MQIPPPQAAEDRDVRVGMTVGDRGVSTSQKGSVLGKYFA